MRVKAVPKKADAVATPQLAATLHRVKLAARLALGWVWMWEGLVPKVFFPTAVEIDLVRNSGWWINSPTATLAALGIAEFLTGLWILSGYRERASALFAAVAMTGIVTLVVWTDPWTLADRFGGIDKGVGLLACSAVVWMLSPIVPIRPQSETPNP